jgi:hypothetical protein
LDVCEGLVRSDFLAKLRNFSESRSAVLAVLFGWHALILSFDGSKIWDILEEFAFLISCLFHSQADFRMRVLPVSTNEKSDLFPYLVRIIRHVAKMSRHRDFSKSAFTQFTGSCFTILKRSFGEKEARLLPPLFRAFCIAPELLRMLLTLEFLDVFIRSIRERLDFPTHEALIGVFDLRVIDQTVADPPYWQVVHAILDLLNELCAKGAFYSDSQFLAEIPGVVSRITEFLGQLFQCDAAQACRGSHAKVWRRSR